jgi:hypothetical protein
MICDYKSGHVLLEMQQVGNDLSRIPERSISPLRC